MKYKKKPVVIEAIQFFGFYDKNKEVIFTESPSWLTDRFGKEIIFFDEPNTLTIKTPEGNMRANIGDYIVLGVNGEIYPCKPYIFEKTYDQVDWGEK